MAIQVQNKRVVFVSGSTNDPAVEDSKAQLVFTHTESDGLLHVWAVPHAEGVEAVVVGIFSLSDLQIGLAAFDS